MIRVLKSSSLLVLQRLAQRLIGIVSTIILARLLTPEDFGIVAKAMLVLWFAQTLCDASTEAYILQQKRIRRADLNSSWTLDLILKSGAFLFMCLAAPLIAHFQNQPELTLIIAVTGSTIVLEALKNPAFMIYKRRQRYEVVVKLFVAAKVAALFISIPIAYIYESYWSIILAQVFAELFLTVMSYRVSGYRPSLCFRKIPEQWHFSKWLIPRSMLGYFRNHLDTLLVSTHYGQSELGAYNNMKYFASIPMLQFLSPLMEPLHVELGKVGDDVREFRYQSDLTFRLIAILAATVVGFLYVTAEPIIQLVLGDQWTPFSTLFSYFALLTIPFVFINQSFRILMVANRTNYIFIYELISTTIIGLVLILAVDLSIENFILIKVSMEIVLSIALYVYAYRRTMAATPLGNTLYFSGLCVLGVTITGWSADHLITTSGTLPSIILNGLYAGLFLIVACGGSYLLVFGSRERKLFGKISRSLLKK